MNFKKIWAVLTMCAMAFSAMMPAAVVLADDDVDLYARQVENIPYYSTGRIKFYQTAFGKTFTLDGETLYDAGGTDRMKRLTATNQNEIWRLMMEEDYLFTGWYIESKSVSAEQLANGEIYAQLDLGGSTPIDAVEVSYVTASNILNDRDYQIGKVPKEYRFDVSDDGINYETVKTVVTDLSQYKDTITTKEEYIDAVTSDPALYDLMNIHKVEFDTTINCRYIRFVMIQSTQDWLFEAGDLSTTIGNYQLYTYNTWMDDENQSDVPVATKDSNGVYEMSKKANDSSGRNIIGFTNEKNLTSKKASRVTYRSETIGKDWNLDEGTIPGSWGNFALHTDKYENYTNEYVYLQYDFGYPSRIDTIEQWYRNAADTSKVNDIPKIVRIDYGNKNERGITEWTKGQVFTTDMSDSASVGEKKANAYNNFIANGSSTTAEQKYLGQAVKYELKTPVEARFIRIVYLQPTQNGSLPTSNKLLIKRTKLYDLTHLYDANTISASNVQFNDDGTVNFTNTSDDIIKYPGEENANSRMTHSPDVSRKDWYYRHLMSELNNSWTGWRSDTANWLNGKVYVLMDYGADINVDVVKLWLKNAKIDPNKDSERTKFHTRYQYANDVPKTVRVDYGTYGADSAVQWTEGKTITTTVENMDIISAASSDDVYAAYDAEEKTEEQQKLVDAINAVPQTLELPVNAQARFVRIVILDPIQSGIENYTGSNYLWYLNAIKTYGSSVSDDVIKTETVKDGNTFRIAVYGAAQGDDVFLALYDENNFLIECHKADYAGNDIEFITGVPEYAAAKVFLWEDQTAIALCDAEPVK